MRLRVKCPAVGASKTCSHPIVVQDPCTLEQLISTLRDQLYSGQHSVPIRLSLNKKDEVGGSPGATLKSLGICNGDALWVLGDDPPPVRQGVPAQEPESKSEEAPVPRQEAKRADAAESAPLPGGQDTHMQDRQPWNDFEAAASPLDALAFLVHAALLDCGLHLVQDADTAHLATAGELSYIRDDTGTGEGAQASSVCRVRHVGLGSHLAVWGCTQTGSSWHLSLRLGDYVTSDEEAGSPASASSAAASGPAEGSHRVLRATNVTSLWTKLKDAFIYPLLTVLCAEDGVPPPPSIQLLPTEIKMLCLQHLQATDLAALACTCRDMRHVASSEELWERLYAGEFGVPGPSERAGLARAGLKRAFGQAWTERAHMRRRRRRFMPGLPQPGGGPLLVVPHPSPFPGIAGGDYDRLPHPFLGLPRGDGAGAGGFGSLLGTGRRGAMHAALQ